MNSEMRWEKMRTSDKVVPEHLPEWSWASWSQGEKVRTEPDMHKDPGKWRAHNYISKKERKMKKVVIFVSHCWLQNNLLIPGILKHVKIFAFASIQKLEVKKGWLVWAAEKNLIYL